MSLPRRVLIAVTDATAKFHNGTKTGMFISEVMHSWKVFVAAGFQVDLASENGAYTVDDLSQTPGFLNGETKATWEDESSPFRVALSKLATAADLKPEVYGLFFASAGHAALIDYPKATALQRIAEDVWARGGVVSTVCHGPAILAGVKDRATGELVLTGKTYTGFTNEGEDELDVMTDIKSWHVDLVEDLPVKAAGAKCKLSQTPLPFSPGIT
jgi:D-lactate dehydratase